MQLMARQNVVLALVLATGLGVSSGARADGDEHVSGVITNIP